MAEEKVGLEVSINGGGQVQEQMKGIETSVKSFRQQMREANQELTTSVSQFGATSKEAANAAKKVAELRDVMDKAKTLSQSYNPDEKFKSLSIAIQGVARGFEAYQGALGIIGVKSKDVEEQLAKVQSAMAFADGLSNILSMKESFVGLASIIKTQVISAFTTLRGALIATGIGALAVALGVLIANFDRVKAQMEEWFPILKQSGDFLNTIKKNLMGFASAAVEVFKGLGDIIADLFKGNFSQMVTDAKNLGARAGKAFNEGFQKEAKNQLEEAARKKIQSQVESNERMIKLMQAAGKDTAQIERETATLKVAALKKGTKEYEDAVTEAAVTDLRTKKAAADKAAAAAKAQAAKDKTLREEQAKIERENRTNLLRQNDDLLKEGRDANLKSVIDAKGKEVQVNKISADQIAQVNANATANEATMSQGRVSIYEQEQQAKAELRNLEVAGLDAIANLIGQHTAAGKAFAIASTTISTYDAAQKAYASQMALATPDAPVRAAIAAGVAIATGLARVKGILSVQVPGGKGGGSSSVASIPSAASSTIKPQVQTQTPVAINQAQVNQMGDRSAIRAYVVETDMQNSTRRNQRIERAAVLGG
jgi:hypothetical protein